MSETATEEKETLRVEAFSDGVYSIAITLLVLELKVPHNLAPGHSLASALWEQWPSYIAFFVNFATIGVMWINHHRLFTIIRKSDTRLLVFNLLLLLAVTIVPFPTNMLAEYFSTPDARTAALIYCLHGFNLALTYRLLWWHVARDDGRLLASDVDLNVVRGITHQYRYGPLLYLVSFGAAFLSVPLSVGLNVVYAAFFALPPPQLRRPPAAG